MFNFFHIYSDTNLILITFLDLNGGTATTSTYYQGSIGHNRPLMLLIKGLRGKNENP